MIQTWRRWLWLTGIASSLGLAAAAHAEPFQPFKGLFGSRSASEQRDVSRPTEIQVQLAWLSDRITFPYFLEAHVKGSYLEIRGYVPTKAVREQAVSLAKLNCPLPVIDSLKEHSAMAVHYSRREPEQLKSAVETALREAFPGQRLNVECQSDGTVQIAGAVRSYEQKLAISQSLRRLHGCASVNNYTEVGSSASPLAAPTMKTAAPAKTAPPAKAGSVSATANANIARLPAAAADTSAYAQLTPEQKRSGPFSVFTRTPPPQPQAKPADDVKITTVDAPGPVFHPAVVGSSKAAAQLDQGQTSGGQGVVAVSNQEPLRKTAPITANPAPPTPTPAANPPAPKTAATGPLSAAQLKRRIETAVPGVSSVVVTFTSKTDVRVECAVRPGGDSGVIAGHIYALRELDGYNIDLQLQLPLSEQKQ